MKIDVVVVCIYWRFIKMILEIFEFYFLIFFKKQPYNIGCGASNRRHRVKHHVGFLVLTDVVMIFTMLIV